MALAGKDESSPVNRLLLRVLKSVLLASNAAPTVPAYLSISRYASSRQSSAVALVVEQEWGRRTFLRVPFPGRSFGDLALGLFS